MGGFVETAAGREMDETYDEIRNSGQCQGAGERERERERDRTEDSDLISISNLVILQAKGFQLSK